MEQTKEISSSISSSTTTTTPTLPIIDISPFLQQPPNEEEKQKVAKALHEACVNVGFFYVDGHGIDQSELNNAIQLARTFFALDTQQKQEIAINNEQGGGVRGYQRLGENVTQYKRDWHEGIDIYKELESTCKEQREPRNSSEKSLLLGRNQWPREPLNFKETFEDYVEKMKHLGFAIMHAMAMGLGLTETYFDKYLDNSYWVMRIIGYPPLESSEGVGISCGEHCDYGCLTMVNQDNTKGALQVRSTSGEWINADPIPGLFVMNIGDMVKVWTNGLYQSTLHRVIHKSKGNYRVSIPFFFEPNYDAFIAPLDCCITDERPLSFSSVVYGDHLLSKVSNNFAFNQTVEDKKQENEK